MAKKRRGGRASSKRQKAAERVRAERGLGKEGIVEMQPTEPNVNLSGGKNQDKTEESRRTEQRLSKNKTGNKRKESNQKVKKEEVVEVVV